MSQSEEDTKAASRPQEVDKESQNPNSLPSSSPLDEGVDDRISKSRVATPLPDWAIQGSFEVNGIKTCLIKSPERLEQAAARSELESEALKRVYAELDETIAPYASMVLRLTPERVLAHCLVPDRTHAQIIYTELADELAAELGQSREKSYRYYAQLRFDPAFHAWAQNVYETEVVSSRVQQLALAGGSLVCVLAIVFGFLRVNHQTRGFYRGRLQLLVLAGVLLLLVGAAQISTAICWL